MEPSEIAHKNIRITGRVQGVGFRYAARNEATALGIKGFVRNLPNGDVYMEAEGTLTQLEDYVSWCHEGPVRAVIRNVDVYDGDVMNFEGFKIR